MRPHGFLSTIALSTTTVVLSSQPALAQIVDEYLVIANSLLSKGIELNVKNQHLFKEIIYLRKFDSRKIDNLSVG